MRRGDGDERSHVGERAFVASHGSLDQLGRDEVPMQCAGGSEALLSKPMGAGAGLRRSLRSHKCGRFG